MISGVDFSQARAQIELVIDFEAHLFQRLLQFQKVKIQFVQDPEKLFFANSTVLPATPTIHNSVLNTLKKGVYLSKSFASLPATVD